MDKSINGQILSMAFLWRTLSVSDTKNFQAFVRIQFSSQISKIPIDDRRYSEAED